MLHLDGVMPSFLGDKAPVSRVLLEEPRHKLTPPARARPGACRSGHTPRRRIVPFTAARLARADDVACPRRVVLRNGP